MRVNYDNEKPRIPPPRWRRPKVVSLFVTVTILWADGYCRITRDDFSRFSCTSRSSVWQGWNNNNNNNSETIYSFKINKCFCLSRLIRIYIYIPTGRWRPSWYPPQQSVVRKRRLRYIIKLARRSVYWLHRPATGSDQINIIIYTYIPKDNDDQHISLPIICINIIINNICIEATLTLYTAYVPQKCNNIYHYFFGTRIDDDICTRVYSIKYYTMHCLLVITCHYYYIAHYYYALYERPFCANPYGNRIDRVWRGGEEQWGISTRRENENITLIIICTQVYHYIIIYHCVKHCFPFVLHDCGIKLCFFSPSFTNATEKKIN